MEGEIPKQDDNPNLSEPSGLESGEDVIPSEVPAPKAGTDKFDPNEPISIPGIHEPETLENTPDTRSEAQKEHDRKKLEVESNYENRLKDWHAVRTELEQFTGFSLGQLREMSDYDMRHHHFKEEGSADRIQAIIKTLETKKEEIDRYRKQAREKLLQEFGLSI